MDELKHLEPSSEATILTAAARQAAASSELIDVPPGLKGVAATHTRIGCVRGLEGFYHYRQYSAIDLAQQCSFEEVMYLLIEQSLPTACELETFQREVRPLRTIPDEIRDVLPAIA